MKNYQIRAENLKTGKSKNFKMKCFFIGNVIKKLALHGWIVTKHYEI